METKIILSGKLQNLAENEFEGKKVITLQFLNDNSGKLEIINVKVDAEHLEEVAKFKNGDNVKILVKLNTYNNNIYYKFAGIAK